MAMTIESVPQGLRNNADDLDRNKLLPILAGRLRAMADAIDANITQPAQAVDDAALEALVEDSGGLWRDDMFRIHEADLMALLRKAATRALSAEKAGWREGFSSVPDELIRLTIRALRDVDTEMSATGRATMRFSQLASDLNGTLPASPTPDKEG